MQPLNYEQLVDDYNQALNTRLRGFRPAEEYLDIWVPDSDPAKSLLNLVEAAEMSGCTELKVDLGEATLRELNLKKLEELLAPLARVEFVKNGSGKTCMHVEIQSQSGAKPKVLSEEKRTRSSSYRLALGTYASTMDPAHEGEIKAGTGQLKFMASDAGVKLSVLVDKENARVVDAKYSGATSPEQRALFEIFCDIITNVPIQEAAEHAGIKLEYSLRDHAKPVVMGIITPANADPIFDLPVQLIRQIYSEFKTSTHYTETTNFFDRPPGEAWMKLSTDDKKAKVQKFFDDYVARNAGTEVRLQVTNLKGQGFSRIFCEFQGNLSSTAQAALLMHLEHALREAFAEHRLEIFLEEKKDQNSKRRL